MHTAAIYSLRLRPFFLMINKHSKDVIKHSDSINLKYPLPCIHFQTLSQSKMMQIAIMVSRKAVVCFFMI